MRVDSAALTRVVATRGRASAGRTSAYFLGFVFPGNPRPDPRTLRYKPFLTPCRRSTRRHNGCNVAHRPFSRGSSMGAFAKADTH